MKYTIYTIKRIRFSLKNKNFQILVLLLMLLNVSLYKSSYSQTWVSNNLTNRFSNSFVEDITYHSDNLWILADGTIYKTNGDSAIALFLDSCSNGYLSNFCNKDMPLLNLFNKFIKSRNSLFIYNKYYTSGFIRIINNIVSYKSLFLNKNEKVIFSDTDLNESIYFISKTKQSKFSNYFIIKYDSLNNQHRNKLITLKDSAELIYFSVHGSQYFYITRTYFNNPDIYYDNIFWGNVNKYEINYHDNLHNGFQTDKVKYNFYETENDTYILSSNGKLFDFDSNSLRRFWTTLSTNGACFWFLVIDNQVYYTDNQGFKKYDIANNILSIIESDIRENNIASTGYKFRNIIKANDYIYGFNGSWDQRTFCNYLSNGIRIFKYK